MANRRPQGGGRRMDFGRNDRGNNFRGGVSPWQGGGPGGDLPNLLPLGGATEATLAIASNLINLLQPRQNPVPSLLDMPIRRDFGPTMNRYDRGYGPNRMGNQGNFRRTGTYNRAGERINNRKPFRPNDGQRQQNKGTPKKDADSKAKPSKESDETGDKSDKNEEKKESPKTRYDDVNQTLLRCHICNKSMWDGRSFENHLNGRAHAIMMQKTAESYALTADTMRQEFKIREMKRTRKTGQQTMRDFYCAMCDMYAADGAIHRTTVGHRKLKKYLHPACTSCHKEMPTRIELDEHRLSAEHLRQLQDKQDTNITKPKPEVMVFSTLNMEQMYLRDDRQRSRRSDRRDKDADAARDADKDSGAEAGKDKTTDEQEIKTDGVEVKEETDEVVKKEDGEDKEAEEKKLQSIDKEDTVLDYKEGDDVAHVTQDMLPAYSTERGVGRSFLKPLNCIQCQLCHKLLDSEETAEVHLRTWRHHQLFTYLLHEKNGHLAESQQSDSGKRSHTYNDDSTTWKRRKTAPKDDDDDDDQDEPEPEPAPQPRPRNGHEDDPEEKEGKDKLFQSAENPDEDILAAEDLEDWEQSVDEILEDVKRDNEAENQEQEAEPEPEPERELEPVQEPAKQVEAVKKAPLAHGTPRGRGRGRGRGRSF